MELVEVRVVTRSSMRKVEEVGEGVFKIWVHAAPEKGRANEEVIKLLSEYLSIPHYKIKILRGEYSRKKTFALDMPSDSRKIGSH